MMSKPVPFVFLRRCGMARCGKCEWLETSGGTMFMCAMKYFQMVPNNGRTPERPATCRALERESRKWLKRNGDVNE